MVVLQSFVNTYKTFIINANKNISFKYNLTYLHCLQHSFFKHLFNLYYNYRYLECFYIMCKYKKSSAKIHIYIITLRLFVGISSISLYSRQAHCFSDIHICCIYCLIHTLVHCRHQVQTMVPSTCLIMLHLKCTLQYTTVVV